MFGIILAGVWAVATLGALRTAYQRGYRAGDREGEARMRRRVALEALSGRATWKFQREGVSIHGASPDGTDYFGRASTYDWKPHDAEDWVRSDGVVMDYDEQAIVGRAYKAWSRSQRIYEAR